MRYNFESVIIPIDTHFETAKLSPYQLSPYRTLFLHLSLVSFVNDPSDLSEPDRVNGPSCAAQVSVDGLGRSHIRWQLHPCTPCPCKSSRARTCIYIYVYSLDPCSHLRLTQLSAGVSTAIRGSPLPLPDGGWIAFCVIFCSRFIRVLPLSMR